MYHNPLTEEEQYRALVKDIESKSTYKRQAPPEKKYMSVPEMRRLLGLGKTDSYWLVHKNFFTTEVISGQMRVELESFEAWYANQVKYHKVTGEEPGLELKKRSYSAKDIAKILDISEWQVYEEMKKAQVEYVLVDYWKRFPKEAFDRWYRRQDRFRNARDREKVRTLMEGSMRMPEMAKLLGINRHVVYEILKNSEVLKTIEIDGKKRVTKDSFYEWYEGQSRYHIASEDSPDAVKEEDNRRLEVHRMKLYERDGNTRNIGNEEFLTIQEAAILADMNPATIQKWIRKGRIEAIQYSKIVRIPRKPFEERLRTLSEEDRTEGERLVTNRAGIRNG